MIFHLSATASLCFGILSNWRSLAKRWSYVIGYVVCLCACTTVPATHRRSFISTRSLVIRKPMEYKVATFTRLGGLHLRRGKGMLFETCTLLFSRQLQTTLRYLVLVNRRSLHKCRGGYTWVRVKYYISLSQYKLQINCWRCDIWKGKKTTRCGKFCGLDKKQVHLQRLLAVWNLMMLRLLLGGLLLTTNKRELTKIT